MIKIQGLRAWENISKISCANWSASLKKFDDDFTDIEHVPKFLLGDQEKFFCMGSCFARNVEEHLMYLGVNVLSKKIINSIKGWSFRINGIVNKFTTESMLNEVEWLLKEPDFGGDFFEESSGGWRDLQLVSAIKPSPFEEVQGRRQYLSAEYFSRLRSATVVVLTLGFNEVWFDTRTGYYLNAAPSYFSARRDPDRYFLQVTGVEQNVAALERIRDVLKSFNPAMKMIVTVSPVPLADSFQPRNVLISNTLSKSTLRVAAEMFAQGHSDVDYFPTYDVISMMPRQVAFAADGIHVTDAVVGAMMRMFLRLYLQREPAPVDFNEIAYLAANPDVDAAVRAGDFESGFQHWQYHGAAEGRALRPEGGPTALMIAAGAV